MEFWFVKIIVYYFYYLFQELTTLETYVYTNNLRMENLTSIPLLTIGDRFFSSEKSTLCCIQLASIKTADYRIDRNK